MVQKKVANKLGIQAVQAKTNKLLVNLKPSSCQQQEGKSKGADLKKKMKKSRPTKRSDIERLGSENMMRQVPQPGKPPPPVFPQPVASPQKKSPVKTSEATPNYMKSTSSSDARKEQSQVSSRNLQTLFDSKSSSSKKSSSTKASLSSVSKGARVLARTSSLKLVRALTKTTCFKPARASAKRCSPLVLRENLNAQRATCSSTLKNSKFPAYLELSSGGTESEGTSVMKVCSYTYCSLNGHHHDPLPPLRNFLSARRRMLKAQRGRKLGCTSPRRSNSPSNIVKADQVGQMNFDEPSPNQRTLSGSMTSSVTGDFFIQIFSKEREATAETNEVFNHMKPLVVEKPGDDEKPAQLDNQQVLEILSDESLLFGIESNEDSNANGDAISRKMDAAEYNEEVNNNSEEEEGGRSFFPSQEEKSSTESLSQSDEEVEGKEIIPIDNTEFGLSYMDWEVENYSISPGSGQDVDFQEESIEFGSSIVPSNLILQVNDIVIRCFEEIQPGGFLQQSLDEGSVSSNGDSYQNFEIEEYIEGPDDKSKAQLQGLAAMVEADAAVKLAFNTSLISIEKPIEDPYSAESDTTRMYLQDDNAAEEIWDLDSQDFHDIAEQSSKAICKGPTSSHDKLDPRQYDANSSNLTVESETVNGSLSPEGKNSDAEDEDREQVHFEKNSDAEVEDEDREKVHFEKASIRIDLDDNHLKPLDTDQRSDETLAGEETIPISMCTSSNSIEFDILGRKKCPDLAETCIKLKGRTGSKRFVEVYEEPKEFNPRGPNFLPVDPDPEAEKVDLKHQMIDERKNADEWMLDYAIQQAVTKLVPVRKKKVALLVEAFETVMPAPRLETQPRHASIAFTHARTIQACS